MRSLQHLVVVIPGIGGSVLRPPGAGTGGWETGRRGLGRVLLRPSELRLDRELVATELITTCRVFPPFFTIDGYQERRNQLLNRFDAPVIETWTGKNLHAGTDVLFFPYDFRHSIADAAEELDRAVGTWLAQVPEERRARRVVLLAHSMGGLVARYWLGPLGGHPWCKALITLGTPHRGAPKALNWLVNGAPLPTATEVLRGWPSVYELLPQYEAVLDAPSGRPFEMTEIPDTMPGLRDYAPRFSKMAAAARAVHERIHDDWAAVDPERRPPVIPFAGRGHATPSLLTFEDGRLRIEKKDPEWRGNVGWQGDATVPMISAIPRELGGDEHKPTWRVVPDRHLPLGASLGPLNLLELYAGSPIPSRGGEMPDRPWVGLDLDDIVAARTEWRIGATIQPGATDAESVRVLVDPIHGGQEWTDRFNRTEGGWTVTIPPREPGVYEVTVEARGVPEAGVVTTTDTVVVVDQQQLAEEDR
jgi:hypothetical protein